MTTTTTTTRTDTSASLQDQTGSLLLTVAGYVGHRTVAIGLRSGLLGALARHPNGLSAELLARELGYDPFFVEVWCRGALACGVLERAGDGYRLAPHVDTLLLDEGSPAYLGGMFHVLELPEVFDEFAERLASGRRMWWDECSPEWIEAVARTGRPFNVRLIPGALDRIPGLADRLRHGAVLDTACGTGYSLLRLAEAYPEARVVGVDGDARSVEAARAQVASAGLAGRVEVLHSPLEELAFDARFDVVTNNVSMHECRDIEKVTAKVKEALKPGGWFVISDFAFPDDDAGLRSVPGRVMTGVQFFEALIDDQLLPAAAYRELLERHRFSDVATMQLTPVHAVTHGRA